MRSRARRAAASPAVGGSTFAAVRTCANGLRSLPTPSRPSTQACRGTRPAAGERVQHDVSRPGVPGDERVGERRGKAREVRAHRVEGVAPETVAVLPVGLDGQARELADEVQVELRGGGQRVRLRMRCHRVLGTPGHAPDLDRRPKGGLRCSRERGVGNAGHALVRDHMVRDHPGTSVVPAGRWAVRGAGSIARAFGGPSAAGADRARRSCRPGARRFGGRTGSILGYARACPRSSMDRATGFYPVGCGFDSCRGRHSRTTPARTAVSAVVTLRVGLARRASLGRS